MSDLESSAMVKVTVLGDCSVGKSTLLLTFMQGFFASSDVPNVIDGNIQKIYCDGQEVFLDLWDVASAEEFDRIRPLTYPGSVRPFILRFIDRA